MELLFVNILRNGYVPNKCIVDSLPRLYTYNLFRSYVQHDFISTSENDMLWNAKYHILIQ